MTDASRTRIRIAAVAALASLTLAACGGSGSDGGGSSGGAGPYQWGIDAELSGPVSYFGTSFQAGVAAYVDSANAAGGINGHKIELTSLDSAGDASRSAGNATQLVTADGVNAIFGQALSSNCTAATPVVERYKVPMACISVEADSSYVFNAAPDNSRAGLALMRAAKKTSGKSAPRAALMYLNTGTDIKLSKTIGATAKSEGVDLVSSEQINLTATDVSPQVAKVVAAKPDVVLVSETGPGMVSVLKGLRAGGLNAPVVWMDGSASLASLATSTDTNVYAFTANEIIEPDASEHAAKAYVAAVRGKIKDATTATGLNSSSTISGYLTAYAFGEAMQRCGYPCSGERLKVELEKTDFSLTGVISSYKLTAADHYPFTNFYMYHVVGTRTTLVDTYPTSNP